MRYLIRDKSPGPQGFPLDTLLERVLEASNHEQERSWILEKVRGYGLEVCELEDRVLSSQEVTAPASKILKLARDPNQWFFDLHCFDKSLSLSFGLLDSTMLFVDGDEEKASLIAHSFRKVTKH